jgi:hypothetical protein
VFVPSFRRRCRTPPDMLRAALLLERVGIRTKKVGFEG